MNREENWAEMLSMAETSRAWLCSLVFSYIFESYPQDSRMKKRAKEILLYAEKESLLTTKEGIAKIRAWIESEPKDEGEKPIA